VLERSDRESPAGLQVGFADLNEAENLRHYCRNCRARLATSVSNAREAFCSPGCHSSFFRPRCRVCEDPIEQPTRGGVRFTCNKAKCKRAWRAGFGLGRYHTPNHANSIRGRPVNTGSKVALNDDRARAWRVAAAAAPLSASQYHCATVGAADAVAAADRTNAAHWRRFQTGGAR
jgi:hypothetical protein